jgi:hypothetical protein
MTEADKLASKITEVIATTTSDGEVIFDALLTQWVLLMRCCCEGCGRWIAQELKSEIPRMLKVAAQHRQGPPFTCH